MNQSGNVLFVLFGAVAIAAVIGSSANVLMRGPVKGMNQLNQSTLTQTQLATSSRMLMLDAATLGAADCDGDRLNEAREWKAAAGAGPDGVAGSNGGGFIPDNVGAAKRDTWGTPFGYCVWDHGAVIDSAACGGATQRRLQGGNFTNLPVIAIISAGKDKTFQTPCRDFATADVNTNGKLGDAGDLQLLTPSGDDMVSVYSYAQANEENPNLWQLNVDSAGNVVAVMDSSVESVAFTGSNAAFDGSFKMTGSKGLIIPDQMTMPTCDAARLNQVRRNTSADPVTLEICESGPYAWKPLATGTGSGGGGGGGAGMTETRPSPTDTDFMEISILQPSVVSNNQWFGSTGIMMDSKHAIIPAGGDNSNKGAAYVVNYITGQQISRLIPPTTGAYFSEGWTSRAVDINGQYAAVGERGKAYLFNIYTGDLIHTFSPDIVNMSWGRSLAMSDKYVFVGGSENAVYVFSIATGQKVTKILPDPADNALGFGNSFSVSGNTLVIGAVGSTVSGLSNAGKVMVYNAGTFEKIYTLQPQTPIASAQFGYTVVASGKYLAIGTTGPTVNLKSVYIYDVADGTYLRTLQPSDDPDGGDGFGTSLDISGDYLIAGSRAKPPTASGGAYIFNLATGAETRILMASDTGTVDRFGSGVAIYGSYALVGAEMWDGPSNTNNGAVYLFNNGDHHNAKINVTQTGGGISTQDSLGWVVKRASDTAQDAAGIAFTIGDDLTTSSIATSAIQSVREGDPNAAGLAFKMNDGNGQLKNSIYLGTNGRLGMGPVTDSTKLFAALQIGEHGAASWNNQYIYGLLVTDETGAVSESPVYFGPQTGGANQVSILYKTGFAIEKLGKNDSISATGPVLTINGITNIITHPGDISSQNNGMNRFRFSNYDNDAIPPQLTLRHTRAVGGLIQNGDRLGDIQFVANDGSHTIGDYQAVISAVVDGTVDALTVPTKLVFGLDPVGNSINNEAMVIKSDGLMGINQSSPKSMLHVGGRIVSNNGIRIGNDTNCSSADDEGTLRYAGAGVYEMCDGSTWTDVLEAPSASAFNYNCSPNPFDFYDIRQATTSTVYYTNKVIISGVPKPCWMESLSTTLNTHINVNGTWQNWGYEVKNGDVVYFRGTTSASNATIIDFTVTLGDKVDYVSFTTPETCTGTPGNACIDGTKYAGLSPDVGTPPMYTTRCDAGMTWNGAACTGTRLPMKWSDCAATTLDTTNTNVTSGNITGGDPVAKTGFTDTISLSKQDSCNSANNQQHEAAVYCSNLVTSGRSDWYLPSQLELQVLYNNRVAIGNFLTTAAGVYWSSSELSATSAYGWVFNSASSTNNLGKTLAATYVRCVRKGVY